MKQEAPANHPVLTRSELRLIADLLGQASDEFESNSCNDFSVPLSKETKRIAAAIIKFAADDDWDYEESPKEFLENAIDEQISRIGLYDNWAANYFTYRCGELASNASKAAPLSAAELQMISELLEFAVEQHAEWFNNGDEDLDLTLDATDENKALFAAVIERHAAPTWKEDVNAIMAANEEISVPDFWVMSYFSERCRTSE
jgi:hypothetical protein